jgi:hypothetical protein
MNAAHWQGGKNIFPSQDGSGFEAQCFESIEDAAAYACVEIVERLEHAYDEWQLGIDGATPLRKAAQYMERAEAEFGPLEDGQEDPEAWLREDREARSGEWFVAACGGQPLGACNVQPTQTTTG